MFMFSSLKLSTTTVLGKQEEKKLVFILNYLIDNPEAAEFLQPVEWESLGLMDYPMVVKHPMHLYKVQEKLKAREYRLVEEVLDHIQLIWDNCKDYNPSGPFYSLADKMERSFKKMIKNYLPNIQITVPSKNPVPNPTTTPSTNNSSNPQSQPPPPRVRPPQNRPTHQSSFQEEPISEEQSEQIPQSEKNRFNQRLKQITQQQLAQIITIIQEHSPEAFKELGGNRSQIIIDSIDPVTFKKLNERIDDFLEGEKGVTKKVKA